MQHSLPAKAGSIVDAAYPPTGRDYMQHERNTLPRIESGGHHPNLDTVNGIIISYRLPLSYFFQEYTSFPTRAEWKHLEQMNKEVIRYNKSKKKIMPQTGTQLQLPF